MLSIWLVMIILLWVLFIMWNGSSGSPKDCNLLDYNFTQSINMFSYLFINPNTFPLLFRKCLIPTTFFMFNPHPKTKQLVYCYKYFYMLLKHTQCPLPWQWVRPFDLSRFSKPRFKLSTITSLLGSCKYIVTKYSQKPYQQLNIGNKMYILSKKSWMYMAIVFAKIVLHFWAYWGLFVVDLSLVDSNLARSHFFINKINLFCCL
jgi:hypothetical protein